jgi:hypothetical protein
MGVLFLGAAALLGITPPPQQNSASLRLWVEIAT